MRAQVLFVTDELQLTRKLHGLLAHAQFQHGHGQERLAVFGQSLWPIFEFLQHRRVLHIGQGQAVEQIDPLGGTQFARSAQGLEAVDAPGKHVLFHRMP